MNIYIRHSNSLQVKYFSLHEQIERALNTPDDVIEIERVRKLAEDNLVKVDNGQPTPKVLNLFEIMARRTAWLKKSEQAENKLLECMMKYIEQTISTDI